MQLNELLEFIDLVKNPDKYKAKVDELIAYNKTIEANIQLTEDIADIAKAKTLTAKALNEATAQIDAAKIEAKRCVADAQAQASKLVSTADERRLVLENWAGELKAREDSLILRSTSLAKLEADVADRSRQVEQDRASLTVQLQEVAERLEKLKSVMG